MIIDQSGHHFLLHLKKETIENETDPLSPKESVYREVPIFEKEPCFVLSNKFPSNVIRRGSESPRLVSGTLLEPIGYCRREIFLDFAADIHADMPDRKRTHCVVISANMLF